MTPPLLVNLAHVLAVACCDRCAHFDGEGFCALPEDDKAITGYISDPAQAVCAQWAAFEPDEDGA